MIYRSTHLIYTCIQTETFIEELYFISAFSAEVNGGPVPDEVAIKVFKTTLTEFKNRADYVKGDVRYFKDEFKKQNPRKIMKIWAQKEEFNLKRYEKRQGKVYGCVKVIY